MQQSTKIYEKKTVRNKMSHALVLKHLLRQSCLERLRLVGFIPKPIKNLCRVITSRSVQNFWCVDSLLQRPYSLPFGGQTDFHGK